MVFQHKKTGSNTEEKIMSVIDEARAKIGASFDTWYNKSLAYFKDAYNDSQILLSTKTKIDSMYAAAQKSGQLQTLLSKGLQKLIDDQKRLGTNQDKINKTLKAVFDKLGVPMPGAISAPGTLPGYPTTPTGVAGADMGQLVEITVIAAIASAVALLAWLLYNHTLEVKTHSKQVDLQYKQYNDAVAGKTPWSVVIAGAGQSSFLTTIGTWLPYLLLGAGGIYIYKIYSERTKGKKKK
jgi:hypothetical protein